MATPRSDSTCRLSRRRFLAAGATATAAACSRSPVIRTGARRPNILYFMPDQMRAQAMGCMENPDVKTPNINRLAGEGVLFRNTFANTPVCCPARAILQTGQYAHRNGVMANDLRLRENRTGLAEVLRGEGYRTGFVGKWHLDGGPRMPGFVPPGPRRQGYEYWAANECNHNYTHSQYFRDSPDPIPINRFETGVWADRGLEFLEENRGGDRPFLLMIQPGPPHNPYLLPPSQQGVYDPAKIRLRPNWKPGTPKVPGRKEIANYYAMISDLDEHFGRLLKALDDWGMADDTIVVFNSDHGDMLGSHGQRLKRKPWEESIRVPGVFRYPRKIRTPRVDDAILTHADMMPTLLHLCGAPVSVDVQGADLSRVVLGETAAGPDAAFFQIFGPQRATAIADGWRGVRTRRYMYATYRDRPWVLYDLEEDPYEQNNLVKDRAAASLLSEMEGRVNSWMMATGDSWDYNWKYMVEDDGRLYKHKAFYSVGEYLEWVKQHPAEDEEIARRL